MKDKEKSNKIIIIAVVLIIIALSIVIVITLRERKTEVTNNTIAYIENNINENKNVATTNDNVNVIDNVLPNNSTNIENSNNSENTTVSNTSTENNATNINNTTKIISQLSPSGFAGSSMLKVVLYEDKSVYLLHYDGEGYNEENIFNKELLASNVDSIYSKGSGEDFESIVLKGEKIQIVSTLYNWITFE